MSRYVCVHGHFYQPPRENPWLEEVELEDSAHPYHDWNERITAECYSPNSASRILDAEGRIRSIVNNYASMSFNFGPTLLSWLEHHAPTVFEKILEADQESVRRLSGHGNALAQGYSHMILPLAWPRDVRTQILWGIEGFRCRFGRDPEGMWLPETAVDTRSLEALAELGLQFTILAPHQAARTRPLDGGQWADVGEEQVDSTRPYLVRLPSGRSVAVFFYDAPISRAVSFENLLVRGDSVAQRMLSAFDRARGRPQLVSVATDGETYGHHHRHGDMALAYALQRLASSGVEIVNYGEFLERHPPTHEVELVEGSSWSCAHGVERWRADCGCNSGAHPEWSQAWRAPLRRALDQLRTELDAGYEERGRELLVDPWAARDDYIHVVLDRSEASLRRFVSEHSAHELGSEEVTTALKLLEMQRHAMLMYTSCGWFFDDLAGLETVQVMRYAGRAAQLAQELFADGLEDRFEAALAEAQSNDSRAGDGRSIYRRQVLPGRVDLPRVGAHYAVSSVFSPERGPDRVFCYTVRDEARQRWRSGTMTLDMGRVQVASELTREAAQLGYVVMHLGGHNVVAGVAEGSGEDEQLLQAAGAAFSRADIPETMRLLEEHFGGLRYSLASLFRDERRRVVNSVLEATMEDLESHFQRLFQQHAPLMQFLVEGNVPLPKALRAVAELSFETQLRRLLSSEELPVSKLRELWTKAREWELQLDEAGLGYAMEKALERAAAHSKEQGPDPRALERFYSAAAAVQELALPVDLHNAQNVCYELLTGYYPERAAAAAAGDSAGGRWVELARALGGVLRVRVPD